MATDLTSLLDLLPWRDAGDRIFISYRRRGDSAGFAARLADRLVDHFGADQCFRDIEDIESGVDFVHALEDAVHSCEAMIVVIGSDWVTMTDDAGDRRLDNPRDFVRIEVATALERDIRVIPALVSGATMPRADDLPPDLRALARRQAHELTDSRWDYDVGQLVASIERMGVRPRTKRGEGLGRLGGRLKLALAGAAAVLLVTVGTLIGTAGMGELDAGGAVGGGIADPPAAARSGAAGGEAGGAASRDVVERTPVDDAPTEPGFGTKGSEQPPAVSPESRPAAGSSTPGKPPAPEPVADPYVDELIEAIRAANDEEIYAHENLDPQGLGEHFADAALQGQVGSLLQLSSGGESSYNVLHEQRFDDFRVDEARGLAEVDVFEVWSSEHRNAFTGACVHRIAAYPVPQTVHLRRVFDGSWRVYNVVTYDVVVPPAGPC